MQERLLVLTDNSLSRNGVIPSVWFAGIPSTITSMSDTNLQVTAPVSVSGRITLNNNCTGMATSQTDYVYPPHPITITKYVNTNGYVQILNIMYSMNGGAWATMGSLISAMSTDSFSFKAMFKKTNGGTYFDADITAIGSTGTYQTSPPITLTLSNQVSGVDYGVSFNGFGYTGEGGV
jgi:hypothetical protein